MICGGDHSDQGAAEEARQAAIAAAILRVIAHAEPTDEMVDRGARYLRETQQSGKRLTSWQDVPNATKKKWRTLSAGLLKASLPALGAAAQEQP